MSTYNVEFSGKLLAGFDPREVRLHAANRLRMSEAQLDRVFDGRPVVLKKAVDAAAGQRYLGELHRLGMASRLVPLDEAPPAPAASTFKVVYLGRLVDGFDKDAVAVAAARRLHIGPEQVERLFSGKKVVLKRGVSERLGTRYVSELASIGMQATLVDEAAAASTAAPVAATPAVVAPPALISAEARVAGAIPDLEGMDGDKARQHAVSEAQMASLTATQFDMPQAMLLSGDVPEPADDNIDHAATLLVDPARLVEQMSLAESSAPDMTASQLNDLHSAQTMLANPAAYSSLSHDFADSASAGQAQHVESAVPYVKCEQCGHRQPLGPRCRRCGVELHVEAALVAAPAVQVLTPAAEATRPTPALAPTGGLTLEPLAPPPAAEEADEAPAEAQHDVPAAQASPARAAPGLADSLRLQATHEPEADTQKRRKLMIAGAVAAILLLYFLLH